MTQQSGHHHRCHGADHEGLCSTEPDENGHVEVFGVVNDDPPTPPGGTHESAEADGDYDPLSEIEQAQKAREGR